MKFLSVPLVVALSCAALSANGQTVAPSATNKPNVVIIYSDDVGYGDISCDGGTKTHTPNIDALAKTGLRFTDAHSPSSTCTPSRFSLMTGEYAWRQKGTDILTGDAPLIIKPGTFTLPEMMRKDGYATACIGKWHLGLGNGHVDWNGDISPGPLEVGFDTCFIFPATADRVPCVLIQDHRVINLDPKDPISVSYRGKPVVLSASQTVYPTGREHPELETKQKSAFGHNGTIINGIGRIGFMRGGKSALWKDEDLAMTFTKHAVDFIDAHKKSPFFLYFAINDVHVPRVPNPRFVGTSGSGIRGDAIEELDWSVGQIIATLKKDGLDKNTLVIFSSDNGPVINDGYADGAAKFWTLRDAAGERRGGKYMLFEGGTRVPMIVNWPGHVKSGVSHALMSHVDLLRSLADYLGVPVPASAARDSLDFWKTLIGQSDKGRTELVEHSMRQKIALRENLWKYIPQGFQGKNAMLFNLKVDVLENKNVADQFTQELLAMKTELARIKAEMPFEPPMPPQKGPMSIDGND